MSDLGIGPTFSCKTFVPWHLGQLHEGFRHVEAAEDSKNVERQAEAGSNP